MQHETRLTRGAMLRLSSAAHRTELASSDTFALLHTAPVPAVLSLAAAPLSAAMPSGLAGAPTAFSACLIWRSDLAMRSACIFCPCRPGDP